MEQGHLAVSSLKVKLLALLIAVTLCLPAHSALASLITTYAGATGPGLGLVTLGSINTPSPANDDVSGASPNTVVFTEKRFDTFDGIWTIFDVVDDGIATTEYQFTETVTNNTGGVAIGYQVMLGSGADAGWVHQPLGTGLDFDAPDDNSPRAFAVLPTLVYDEVTIDAVGGTILPGESHVFTYAIDVPNTLTKFSIRTSLRELPVSTGTESWSQIKALYK